MDDVHCRILTGGSSGAPQAVGLTYGNHLWSAVGSAFNIGVQPDDCWLCCLPLSHISGLSIVMRSVIYGTAVGLHDGFDARPGRRDPRARRGLGRVAGPDDAGPAARGATSTSPARGRSWSAAARFPRTRWRRRSGAGASVVQTYGLTEACSQVTTLGTADAKRKLGSAGRPLLTTHLRIDDGEILVQGPTVAPGCADADGWLHTGDLGRIDEEGFLYVEDRIDDLIVSGGENVVPAEVEQVLLRHPEVTDAAVVGREDPEWQQAVTAVVVLREDAELPTEELRRHCADGAGRLQGPEADRDRLGAAAHAVGQAAAQGAAMIDRDRSVGASGSTATWRPGAATTASRSPRCSARTLGTATTRMTSRSAAARRWSSPGSASRTSPGPSTSRAPTRQSRPVAIDGDTAVATGSSTYTDCEPGGEVDKVYDNCFVIRFDDDGRCAEFTEWYMERPDA